MENEVTYSYIDKLGNQYGPYKGQQMMYWYQNNLLAESLCIRIHSVHRKNSTCVIALKTLVEILGVEMPFPDKIIDGQILPGFLTSEPEKEVSLKTSLKTEVDIKKEVVDVELNSSKTTDSTATSSNAAESIAAGSKTTENTAISSNASGSIATISKPSESAETSSKPVQTPSAFSITQSDSSKTVAKTRETVKSSSVEGTTSKAPNQRPTFDFKKVAETVTRQASSNNGSSGSTENKSKRKESPESAIQNASVGAKGDVTGAKSDKSGERNTVNPSSTSKDTLSKGDSNVKATNKPTVQNNPAKEKVKGPSLPKAKESKKSSTPAPPKAVQVPNLNSEKKSATTGKATLTPPSTHVAKPAPNVEILDIQKKQVDNDVQVLGVVKKDDGSSTSRDKVSYPLLRKPPLFHLVPEDKAHLHLFHLQSVVRNLPKFYFNNCPDVPVPENPFCELCNVQLGSKLTVFEHLIGFKHTKKLIEDRFTYNDVHFWIASVDTICLRGGQTIKNVMSWPEPIQKLKNPSGVLPIPLFDVHKDVPLTRLFEAIEAKEQWLKMKEIISWWGKEERDVFDNMPAHKTIQNKQCRPCNMPLKKPFDLMSHVFTRSHLKKYHDYFGPLDVKYWWNKIENTMMNVKKRRLERKMLENGTQTEMAPEKVIAETQTEELPEKAAVPQSSTEMVTVETQTEELPEKAAIPQSETDPVTAETQMEGLPEKATIPQSRTDTAVAETQRKELPEKAAISQSEREMAIAETQTEALPQKVAAETQTEQLPENAKDGKEAENLISGTENYKPGPLLAFPKVGSRISLCAYQTCDEKLAALKTAYRQYKNEYKKGSSVDEKLMTCEICSKVTSEPVLLKGDKMAVEHIISESHSTVLKFVGCLLSEFEFWINLLRSQTDSIKFSFVPSVLMKPGLIKENKKNGKNSNGDDNIEMMNEIRKARGNANLAEFDKKFPEILKFGRYCEFCECPPFDSPSAVLIHVTSPYHLVKMKGWHSKETLGEWIKCMEMVKRTPEDDCDSPHAKKARLEKDVA